jgi:hypothetical protein
MNPTMSRALHLLAIMAIALAPTVAAADWTQIRQMVHDADRINDRPKRESLLRKAYADAQESVRRAPRVSNEYLWLANAAGRLAQTVSSKERIALAKVVKENAEKAIALDPSNGPAHMTLGAWHFYVADISWVERNAAKAIFGELPDASYATAVTHLTKALAQNIDNPIEVLWLRGRAYAALDKDEKAEADWRACVAAKPRSAAEQRFQKRAKELLG